MNLTTNLVMFLLTSIWLTDAVAVAQSGCGFAHVHSLRQTDASVRPPHEQSRDSATFPFVVHYKQSTSEEYVTSVIANLEQVWSVEINKLGFLAPHPDNGEEGDDRLDIYLVDDLPAGVGGYAGFAGFEDSTERADAKSYLVIATGLRLEVLQFVLAHEFFHSIQMAYDWWEEIAFMEASANWVTEEVFPDLNFYGKFIPYFQAEPNLSFDYVSIKNPYQYGMSYFVSFLSWLNGKNFVQPVRRMWEDSMQVGDANEPDFVDSAERMASVRGASFYGDFRAFGAQRLLTGNWASFSFSTDAPLWGANAFPFLDMVNLGLDESRESQRPIASMSHAFIAVAETLSGCMNVELRFANETSFALDLVEVKENGMREVASRVQSQQRIAELQINVTESATRYLVISHFGSIPFDPDSSEESPQSFSVKTTYCD
jgi:hypothetical protein